MKERKKEKSKYRKTYFFRHTEYGYLSIPTEILDLERDYCSVGVNKKCSHGCIFGNSKLFFGDCNILQIFGTTIKFTISTLFTKRSVDRYSTKLNQTSLY